MADENLTNQAMIRLCAKEELKIYELSISQRNKQRLEASYEQYTPENIEYSMPQRAVKQ